MAKDTIEVLKFRSPKKASDKKETFGFLAVSLTEISQFFDPLWVTQLTIDKLITYLGYLGEICRYVDSFTFLCWVIE